MEPPVVPKDPPKFQDRASPSSVPYQCPSWSGVSPGGVTIEVIKNGAIIDVIRPDQEKNKGHITFGKMPNNDVVLDHPLASRCHAIVQWRGEDGAAFLFDPGSTHGILLNKVRLPVKEYVPLKSGDMFKLGLSSRLYVYCALEELLHGEVKEERQPQRKEMLQSSVIPSHRSPLSRETLMNPHDNEDGTNAAQRICRRRRENLERKKNVKRQRIERFQKETANILRKKGDFEDLTSGQEATLARNEALIEKTLQELEDLNDELESLDAKLASDDLSSLRAAHEEGTVDEDDFGGGAYYDQVSREQGMCIGIYRNASKTVLDAQTLVIEKTALLKEKADLEKKVLSFKEIACVAASTRVEQTDDHDHEEEDALDAYMVGMESKEREATIKKLQERLASIDESLGEVDALMKRAAPPESSMPILKKRGKESTKISIVDIEPCVEKEERDVETRKRAQEDALSKTKLLLFDEAEREAAKERMKARRAFIESKREEQKNAYREQVSEGKDVLADLAVLRGARQRAAEVATQEVEERAAFFGE